MIPIMTMRALEMDLESPHSVVPEPEEKLRIIF